MYQHTPVMLEEAIKFLDPKPGQVIIDCTLGGGGYTEAIAKLVGETGRVIALDADETAINHAKLKIDAIGIANVSFYHANFRDIKRIVESESERIPNLRIDGIVFDLGLSSAQLEDRFRGFSFKEDSPLNMSFGSLISDRKTQDIVNTYQVSELAVIIKNYGEERFAQSIARSIAKIRSEHPITTTAQLVEAIKLGVPASHRHQRIHFATRTFQALRIATNDELRSLEEALSSLREILDRGAKIVIVSFHSLEDRIVKQFFRHEAKDCICPPGAPICTCHHAARLQIITKKAVQPTEAETAANPRARSAKLRAAVII